MPTFPGSTVPTSASGTMGLIQNAFAKVATAGYANTVGDVYDLLFLLMGIELVVVAIGWGFTHTPALRNLFWKLLGFAVLLWIITEWVALSTTVREGFIQAGLAVGSNVISLADFNDPGNIADFGFAVTAVVFKNISQLNWLWNSWAIIYQGLGGLAIVSIFFIVSIEVFIANIEYSLVTAALLLLVPFLAFQKTAFIGERVFGTILNHAVRLMVLALVVNIVFPVLQQFALSQKPEFQEVLMLVLACGTFLAVALGAPLLARGLIQGSPGLQGSSVWEAATTVTETGAVLGAVGTAGAVAGASALREAVTGASAMRAAAHIGADRFRATQMTSQGYPSRLVGGLGGVGDYAMQRLSSGFRAAVQSGRTRAGRNTTP